MNPSAEAAIREHMFTWMAQPARTGCNFAGILARGPARHLWQPMIAWEEAFLDGPFDLVLQNTVERPVLMVFPTLSGNHKAGVQTLLTWLEKRQARWDLAKVPSVCDRAPPGCVPLAVKCRLDWLPVPVVSEVLGMANTPCMPPTRRAPYVAMAFKVGKQVTKSKSTLPRRPEVNLCDVYLDLDPPAWDRTWTNTSASRKRVLEDDGYPELAAKAKVTFMLEAH